MGNLIKNGRTDDKQGVVIKLRNMRLSQRSAHRHRSSAISAFTILLLCFGIIYWLFHVLTTISLAACAYGLAWLAGWDSFSAPFPRRPENASLDGIGVDRFAEIFRDPQSPLRAELYQLQTCHQDFIRAQEQYQEDLRAWDDYWDGFNDWYAATRWRYRE